MTQTNSNTGLFPSINTVGQRFARVNDLAVAYMADPLDEWKAEEFARAAHILAEWVVDEHVQFGYASQQTCREKIYQRCPSLKALRDLSNRAKHSGKLKDERKPYFETATKHHGDYSRDFAREDFDVDRLVLILMGGTVLDYEDVVQAAMNFWQEFFGTVDPFKSGT